MERPRIDFWIPIVLIVGIWVVAIITGPGHIWVGDSPGYKNPFVHRDLASVRLALSGASERQAPPTVLFELLASRTTIVVTQMLLLAASTIYALLAFNKLDRLSPNWRLTGALLVVVLTASPFYMGFAWLILGEALAFTFVMFGVGAFVRRTARNHPFDFPVLVFSGIGSTLMRPHMLLLWAFMMLAPIVFSTFRSIEVKKLGIAILSLSLMGIVSLSWWTTNNNKLRDSSWIRGNLNHSVVVTMHTTSGISPIAPDIWSLIRKANPPPNCFPINKEGPADILTIWTDVAPAIAMCPEAEKWAEEFPGWYQRTLVQNPRLLWQYLRWAVPRALSQPPTVPLVVPVPRTISELVSGSSQPGFVGTNFSPAPWVESKAYFDPSYLFFLMFLPGILFLRRKLLIGNTRDILILYGAATISFAIVAYGAVLNPNTLIEMARVASPANLAYRYLLIVAIVVSLDSIFKTRSLHHSARSNGAV